MSFLNALVKIAGGALESAAAYHQQTDPKAKKKAREREKAADGCMPCQAHANVQKTREWVRVNYLGGQASQGGK